MTCSSSIVRRVAPFLLAIGILAGCPSKSALPKAAESPPSVADVGSVVVRLSTRIPSGDRRILEEVNAARRLQAEIERRLAAARKLRAASPRVLEVEVTHFRFRPGPSVLGGVTTGPDSLEVEVMVRDGGKVVRRFSAADSIMGPFAGLASQSRLLPLAEAVAQRVVKEL